MSELIPVLVVGATPPPITGLGVANEMVLDALHQAGCLVVHVNPKQVDFSVGRFNWKKILEAVKVLWQVNVAVRRHPDCRAYVTLAQTPLGMVRDMFMVRLIQGHARRIVVHIHGSQLQRGLAALPRPLRRTYTGWMGGSDAGLVLTNSQKANFDGILPLERIHTVTNGFKSNEIPSAAEIETRLTGLEGGRPVRCLFIGSLWENKGYRDVLRAAVILKETGLKVHVKLAGGFSSSAEEAWCVGFIDSHGLHSFVELLGPIRSNAKREVMGWADVSILPSRLQEGVPISLLEGMASGHYLLATAVGGIVDIMTDEVCGSFIPELAPRAIADQLRLLSGNRDILVGAARRNKIVAQERYSERSFCSHVLRFILAPK